MTVFAYRLEAIAWLVASIYLYTRTGGVMGILFLVPVFLVTLIKAFPYGSSVARGGRHE